MILEVKHSRSEETLAAQLAALGVPLDLRCGGGGRCGRCRVVLLSGQWLVDGRPLSVTDPVEVLACRTRLTGESGRVDVPDSSRAAEEGNTALEWNAPPLPSSPESVIGIDLGTTTVAAVKVCGGRVIGRAGAFNAQGRYGDNVVTRIDLAGSSPTGLETLRLAAVETVNRLLDELDTADCVRIAIAGNTVMSSLFHGIDPSSIGVMPFTPPCRVFPVRSAAECGLRAPARVPVLTVPAIAGYVGGDLTAGLAEVGLRPGEMLVDIGTNCEILFATPEGIFCTAAAAGPAFEGAGIACGSRAVPGAIDRWRAPGQYSVLGGGAASGVCGSAMIDFLAAGRRLGFLNEFGRIQPAADSFELAPGVSIFERDIEQLLKAKAAVRAGIRTLAEHCGTGVEKLILAGGFARHLDLGNAVAIDLLPECRCEVVGNTSLAGAARLAVRPERMAELERLIDLPTDLPLNTLPQFEDNYIDALLLP